MSSSKDIFASLSLATKQNIEQPDSTKALLEMKERHPILLAFNKWLKKINTGIQTPEEIKEQNNKIFAAFMFLLDHDYLFYLTVTAQTELMKQFLETYKKVIPIEEEDLLGRIRKEYEQALENNTLIKLHTSSIQKSSENNNLNRAYFLTQSHQSFETYCYVEREYQLLKYEYKKEQIKAFREVFNDEATALMDEVKNNTALPQDIKDEVMEDLQRYLSEFEDELLEVEAMVDNHPLKNVLHTITPEMYSKFAKTIPSNPIPDSTPDPFDDIDNIDLDEVSLDSEHTDLSSISDDIETLPHSKDSLSTDELALSLISSEELSHSEDNLSHSSDIPTIQGVEPVEPKESSNSEKPTQQTVLTTQSSYPTSEVADIALLHKVTNLREKWENVGKAFINPETGRLRHDSLHHAYMRHRKTITRLDQMLENLKQKYVPSINHLEQEVNRAQQIAVNDLKVDLHRFADLLSQDELVSDENQDKVNLYITNLADFVINLDNMSNPKSIKDALVQHLSELEKIEPLFQGELKKYAPQYQQIKDQLQQQIDLKLPEPGVIINPESLPKTNEQPSPPMPRYRKFASHLATFHEQQRLLHTKTLPSIVEESVSMEAPLPSEESVKLVSLNSDMELRLKNNIKTTQMFLTRCINSAKSEGCDTCSLETINALLGKIKETHFKTVDLNDLGELARQLDAQPSNLSIHSFATSYKELEADIRELTPSVTVHVR